MGRLFNDLALKLNEAWIRATGGRLSGMPAVGDAAPDLQLADQDGQVRRLADYLGRWVVLYFYPKDETPGCTTEACRFQDGLGALTALDAQVLGVSTDDSASHRRFAEHHGLGFPLLADTEGQVARDYGVLWHLGPVRFARRRTFLIDDRGRIAKVYLRVAVERHADEVAGEIRARRDAAGA